MRHNGLKVISTRHPFWVPLIATQARLAMEIIRDLVAFVKAAVTAAMVAMVAVVVAATVDLSSKPAVPTAAWCGGFDEASLPQQLFLRAWMSRTKFTVLDIGFVRIAKTGNPEKGEPGDFILVQVPFTGGRWYKA